MRDLIGSQKKTVLSIFTTLLVVGIDRITKSLFVKILFVGESIPLIRNVFHFTLVHNTGIAFGLFKDKGLIFIIIPIVAIILIAVHIYLSRNDHEAGQLYIFAFSLILGGAIGNLIDRLLYGYVIDFIDFRVWPVFNLADSAITVGAILILLKCIPFSAK